MYKENEKLKLLTDFPLATGNLTKGDIVTFISANDVGTRSFVLVKYKEKLLRLPELAVAPLETDTIKELEKLNNGLIKANPELGIYHHNVIIRNFNKLKILLFNVFVLPVKNFLTRNSKPVKVKHDLSDLKDFINEDNKKDIFDD